MPSVIMPEFTNAYLHVQYTITVSYHLRLEPYVAAAVLFV